MKKIAVMVEVMQKELETAEKYAKKAVEYKAEDKAVAETLDAIAGQKQEAVEKMHTHIERIIKEYNAEHGQPPAPMMMIWKWEHEKIMDQSARIKVIRANFAKI